VTLPQTSPFKPWADFFWCNTIMQNAADVQCTDMKWYVVKVQSNREKSVRDSLLRRIKRDGMESFFGQILVPVERHVENKSGKNRVTEQKLFPGYLLVQMVLNEDTWFLVRNTGGVGDFTGAAGHPAPMHDAEIESILSRQVAATAPVPIARQLNYAAGDSVTIKDGAFSGFKGVVDSVDVGNAKVTVLIEIFGRPTPVDLESWQVTVE
jgi:transcription termination/antitermination protein NusG